MANRQHIIELNGQKYDALTGKMLSLEAQTSKKTTLDGNSPKRLDGFTRRPKQLSTTANAVHHKTAKSKTLMRSVVKKPTHNAIKATSAAQPLAETSTNGQKTVFPGFIKPERIIRAQHAPQSQLISKFGRTKGPVKTEAVPVRPAPAPAQHQHVTQAASKVAVADKADPFQMLLNRAESHAQPKVRKTRSHERLAHKLRIKPRTLVVSFSAFALLTAGGFFAYTKVPSLAVRIAATRAGVPASLPSYQPAGFSLKAPVAYNPGEISINYKSNSDDRNFKVIQRTSSWNSEALLDNFVTSQDQPYQTYQANGRTIYIYKGSNATWVDGGVWYQIEGASSLNSDQLLRIANSL